MLNLTNIKTRNTNAPYVADMYHYYISEHCFTILCYVHANGVHIHTPWYRIQPYGESVIPGIHEFGVYCCTPFRQCSYLNARIRPNIQSIVCVNTSRTPPVQITTPVQLHPFLVWYVSYVHVYIFPQGTRYALKTVHTQVKSKVTNPRMYKRTYSTSLRVRGILGIRI